MAHISIRDLRKLSSKSIIALPGATPIKSGNRTVALMIPLKPADPARFDAALARAQALAKGRDPAEDEAFLIEMGIDPTDWTDEAIQALTVPTD